MSITKGTSRLSVCAVIASVTAPATMTATIRGNDTTPNAGLSAVNYNQPTVQNRTTVKMV